MSLDPLYAGDVTFNGAPVGYDFEYGLLLSGEPWDTTSQFYQNTPTGIYQGETVPVNAQPLNLGGMQTGFSGGPADQGPLAGIDRQQLSVAQQSGVLDQIGFDDITGKVWIFEPNGSAHEYNPTTPADKGIIDMAESALGTNLGKLVAALGLGAAGIGLGQALAGSPARLNTPPSQPQQTTPGVAAAQQSLTSALTTPTAQNPNVASMFQPGPTAGTDLESAFRSALAGQRNVSDLALGLSGNEALAAATQAPVEGDIRMQALNQIRNFLGQNPAGAGTPQTVLGPNGQVLGTMVGSQFFPAGSVGQAPVTPPGTVIMPPPLAAGVNPTDPVQQAMREQVLRVLGGQLATPQLDQQFRVEEQNLRNQLARMHGPGYETTTPGIDALNALRQRQEIERDSYKNSLLSSLAPQEAQRGQFGLTLGEQQRQFGANLSQQQLQYLQQLMEGQRQFNTGTANQQYQFGQGLTEQQRQFNNQLAQRQGEFAQGQGQQNLQNYAALTNLGRTPLPTLATTFSGIAPTYPLLGLGDTAAAQRQQEALQQQSALTAFQTDAAERAARASAISGLFGTATGLALGGRNNTSPVNIVLGK